MKYIRKAIALILVAIFIAAVAIGLSVIFAVRNINIITIYYTSGNDVGGSDEFTAAVEEISDGLEQFEGRTIVTVDENEIAAVVEASDYAEFVSVEKIYPCTVNVTVKERLEMFAVESEDGSSYTMHDSECSVISTKSSNENNLDGSPNVLLVNVTEDDYAIISSVCAAFGEKFSSVRAFMESVTIDDDTISGRTLQLALRCGVTMEITEFTEHTIEKAEALFAAFDGMPDYLKVSGVMYCLETDSGAFRVILPDNTVV